MTIIKKILLFALIAVLISSPVFARRYSDPQKSCFTNMRLLLGALEMYNMDNDEMIHEMNEDVIEVLKRGNYLKGDDFYCPKKREPGHYHNQGDLCEDGVIYCDYHGSVEGNGSGKGQVVPPSREYMMDLHRREFNQALDTFIPIIAVIAFIAIICVILPGKKKKR